MRRAGAALLGDAGEDATRENPWIQGVGCASSIANFSS
jgi:hypothetical protein